MNNEFYLSSAWKTLRYRVFETYGRKCLLCGTDQETLHVDHIKPRSLFPELELDINNLQVLCATCNQGKSNRFTTDWIENQYYNDVSFMFIEIGRLWFFAKEENASEELVKMIYELADSSIFDVMNIKP